MQKINFKQQRDLGGILQDASTFLKENFLKIMKPTLIVVLVPLLIGSVVTIIGTQKMYSNMSTMTSLLQIYTNMAATLPGQLLTGIAMLIGYIMFFGYIKLYTEGKEDISLSDLLPFVKSKIIPLFFYSILLVLMIGVGMIFCFLPGIYLGIVFAHFYAIAIIENASFGESWSRCFYLIKNNWWSTFGLYFVGFLIAGSIMVVFYIPIYFILAMDLLQNSAHSDPMASAQDMGTKMSYITPLYNLLGLVASLFFATLTSLKYFSLVEQKDGLGERELINEI